MPTREEKEWGERSRRALGNHLQPTWGRSILSSNDVLYFRSNDGVGFEVVALYSMLNQVSSVWWFAVNRDYWAEWQRNRHMAFLMRDVDGVNYLILNPDESQRLLKNCEQGQSEDKNIHIRRPANMGQEYFVEWQDLCLNGRIKPLPILERRQQRRSCWQPCPVCGIQIKPTDVETHLRLRHNNQP